MLSPTILQVDLGFEILLFLAQLVAQLRDAPESHRVIDSHGYLHANLGQNLRGLRVDTPFNPAQYPHGADDGTVMLKGNPATGVHAKPRKAADGFRGKRDIRQPLHQKWLAGTKNMTGNRAFDRHSRISGEHVRIVGAHELHHHIAGGMIKERQRGCVVWNHLVNAC